jgi:hypothetical protein
MRVEQLVPAEPGWKAIFSEHDGGESQSRILGWAIVDGGDGVAGVIVDPAAPSEVVLAPDAVSPEGGTFLRYRFVPPAPPPPPPLPAPTPAEPEEATGSKGRFKRR